jgi:hypothetical protein
VFVPSEFLSNFKPAASQATEHKVSFPTIELLQATLAEINEEVPLVLVMPPIFTELPSRDDPNANRVAQCKGALPSGSISKLRGGRGNCAEPRKLHGQSALLGTYARVIETGIASALSFPPAAL